MSDAKLHCEDDCREYVIYDVLDDIFRHLSLKSLREVALVSRSWNHAAKRSIRKRGALSRVLLPLQQTQQFQFEPSDYFAVKPDTLLLFCGPRPNLRSDLNLEYSIMKKYHKRVPGRLVMLGVDQAMLDTREVRSCRKQTFYESRSNGSSTYDSIIGLCLPDSEDFTIKVANCVSHEKKTQRKAERILEELHDEDEQPDNPIFLLFSRNGYTIGSHVIRMFSERYANKPLNVWGSTIGDFIKRSDDGYPSYQGTHGFLGILLHGPRLRAHCIVVQIDLEAAMAERLADFAGSFTPRRRCVGLVSGPSKAEMRRDQADSSNYYYPRHFMGMVKRQFPGIDFTGMFNDPEFHYYGCDHTSETGDYGLEHKGALSIMILTYD